MSSSPSERTQPTPSERLSRNLALAGLVGLFVLCLAWELWLDRTGSGTLAVKALPLLIPMLGLWRYRLYTFRWVSLLVWVYCGEGLMRMTSGRWPEVGLAMTEVGLSVVIFIACALQVRQRLGAAKA